MTTTDTTVPHLPTGVHFVGSIPLPTAEATMLKLSSTLPGHIRRLPDGEPADRGLFTAFQLQLLPRHLLDPISAKFLPPANPTLPPANITTLSTFDTTYDSNAISSYATFSRLKDSGQLPVEVKFQVCLPTPVNVIGHVDTRYQAAVERYYTAALGRALSNIQSSVPHDQLAIQIDMALDFAFIERAEMDEESLYGAGKVWDAWFSPVEQGVIDRALTMTKGTVAEDVELGFHFCYGDWGHKHFVEPKDLSKIANVMSGVLKGLGSRNVQWIHFPVPKQRCLSPEDTEAFLGSLREKGCLRLLVDGETEVYFGCVIEGDREGTERTVAEIEKWLERQEGGKKLKWGVATECGSGRTPVDVMDEILETMGKVSKPVR